MMTQGQKASGPQAKRTSGSASSLLLTAEDNLVVQQLLGQRCPSLATAVVQIYRSEAPGHGRWNKRSCGVVCFVKDNPRRSYYIRVLEMDRKAVIFNQEIYNQFRYKSPRPYFHTFESDDGQVGLNFADETEAQIFQRVVEDKLAERRQRRERRAAGKRQSLGGANGSTDNNEPGHFAPPPPSSTGISQLNGMAIATQSVSLPAPVALHQPAHLFFSQRRKGDKKKLKKEDISSPSNFQHISHVGWDPNRGFDLENVDPKLKQFFSRAGVGERELQDKETREFIYEFIEKHGGVEAALMEEEKHHIPTTSTVVPAPAPPPRLSSIARPPPPSKIQASVKTAPEVPLPPAHTQNQQSPRRHQSFTSAPPPPPPPPLTKSAAPLLPQISTPSIPPPPPPPPPPPTLTPPSSVPQAPPPPPSLPPVDDIRSNLMAQIRQGGGSLKPVAEDKRARPSVVSSRGELMDQIRSGVVLKKVDLESLSRSGEDDHATSCGIAGMLQKALQERSAALCLSSSEDEADDEDEWDE